MGKIIKIEEKAWEYGLFKVDEKYLIHVPIGSPSPGFDIVHELNTEEIELYNKVGINGLMKRIEDMKVNYYDYEMRSWR
ncbi:hypothetical protein [Robertkochia aurantiaca]|uniref:hypothetical protein n=1 Tax=Robertkochia aurantiaca TaxID=2873700 RepID=UPI001CC9437A|nr:hypothetical protein [Robertkochia sp. 3YJGBD-33]